MVTKIYAYSNASKGAKLLAETMGVFLLKHKGSSYKPSKGDTVINWGKGKVHYPARTLNHTTAVAKATNKYTAFNYMSAAQVSVPDWTPHKSKVQQWLDQGHKVFARTIVNGHEGAGIVVIKPGDTIPYAPLYTKYIPKDREYRVHVMGGQVIDQVRKVLKADAPKNASKLIRNTANGYVFARREGPNKLPIVVPSAVTQQALAAVQSLGLDFGAVDVIWNASQGKAYVLEVNTAPGIEGTTVQIYASKFKELFNL